MKNSNTLLAVCFGALSGAVLADPTLQDVNYNALSPHESELVLKFSEAPGKPEVFTLKNPYKIIVDIDKANTKLDKKEISRILSKGVIQNVSTIETKQKMRFVLSLKKSVAFDIQQAGDTVSIHIQNEYQEKPKNLMPDQKSKVSLKKFDFQRGEQGQARIILTLSSPNANIDFSEIGDRLVTRIPNATATPELQQLYNVLDFATPVKTVDIHKKDSDLYIDIESEETQLENIAYQIDNQFIIEVGAHQSTKVVNNGETTVYTGEKLSLNFQDIEVRAVLQILSDFSNFNMVTSDNVSGNITLRLQNVPWDQALDIVLRTKKLDKRENGNVLLVGPADELNKLEADRLSNEKSKEDTIALKSELIEINYAKAADLAALLKQTSGTGSVTNALLSSRGNVTIDARTNTLLIQDTPKKLTEIRALIQKLDRPIRQVEIATQIIKSSSNLSEALGLNIYGTSLPSFGHGKVGVASNGALARYNVKPASAVSTAGNTLSGTSGKLTPAATISQSTDGPLFTPTLTGSSKIAFALGTLPGGTLLDLEIQAIEQLTLGKIVARPKLITTDSQKASITQTQQIPYTTSSTSDGVALTTVNYKDIKLNVDVTPQITGDKRIKMDLAISKDNNISTSTSDPPSVEANEIKTQVLVNNGETIVLGGVFNNVLNQSRERVPFFGQIPILGHLFKARNATLKRDELIFFITPKIVGYETD